MWQDWFNLPHYQLPRYSSPATSNEEENKGRGKEKTQPPVAASLFLRHEAKHRQALMRAADIPVRRGTHNNASVRGRELADLFPHVGSGSRRDGGHSRKKKQEWLVSSLLSLFWPEKTKKLTGRERQREQNSALGRRLLRCLLWVSCSHAGYESEWISKGWGRLFSNGRETTVARAELSHGDLHAAETGRCKYFCRDKAARQTANRFSGTEMSSVQCNSSAIEVNQ